MPRFTSVRNFRGALHLFQNRRTLAKMLREALHGSYKMSFITTAMLAIGILYVFFPFDLIPDFIPIAGWLDDGAVIYLVIKRLQKETLRYNRYKAMERRGF